MLCINTRFGSLRPRHLCPLWSVHLDELGLCRTSSKREEASLTLCHRLRYLPDAGRKTNTFRPSKYHLLSHLNWRFSAPDFPGVFRSLIDLWANKSIKSEPAFCAKSRALGISSPSLGGFLYLAKTTAWAGGERFRIERDWPIRLAVRSCVEIALNMR